MRIASPTFQITWSALHLGAAIMHFGSFLYHFNRFRKGF